MVKIVILGVGIELLNFKTLIDVIKNNKTNDIAGVTFIDDKSNEKFVSYREVYSKSLSLLKSLQNFGIKPGDELLFQIDNNEDFIYAIWDCILGGIIAVPVTFNITEEDKIRILGIWKLLKNPFLITSENILNQIKSFINTKSDLKVLSNSINRRSLLINEVESDKLDEGVIYDANVTDVAFVMFSSGSTGMPKGVMLSHENVIAQICATYNSFKLNSKDAFLSWMPLTHTVGLCKYHMVPAAFSLNQYIMTKALFVNNPLIWLQKAYEHKATILACPNFGYKHFLSQFEDIPKLDWNLEHVRILQNSAEPISKSLAEEFLFKLEKYGLNRKSMCPEYGMTEACMAISCTPVGEEYKWYELDRKHMSVGDKVREIETDKSNSLTVVSVGNIIDCCDVRICNDNDEVLDEGTIGHIQFIGKCLMIGYYNDNNSTTNAYTKDGWFKTGDIGFIKDNELTITGRAKDMIISNGLNFYAHDIERVAQEVETVDLAATCSAFNYASQKEEVMTFILYKGELNDFIPLEGEIKRYVNTKTGLDIKYIIPISDIPKTQSGKIQRYKLKEMYLNGDFEGVICELDRLIKNNINNNEHVAPRNDEEKRLVKIWNQILDNNMVGIDDNFFEIGGHSLKAIQTVSMIHREMNVEIPVSELFNNPTIRQLGECIEKSKESMYKSIKPEEEKETYELSSAQNRLFALYQLNKNEMNYNGFWHALKRPAPNPLAGDLGKPAFYHVDPGSTGRREMEVIAGVGGKPLLGLRVLVGPVVVQHQVDLPALGRAGLNAVQKRDEFAVPVPRLAGTNHFASQNVEGGKQRSRSVPPVVMCLTFGNARPERQNRLRTVQGLDLAFLIHAEYQGFIRRVQVQAHDVPHFGYELRIGAELERLGPMRLQTIGLPDAVHGRMTHPLGLRHGPHAPLRGVGGFRMKSSLHDGGFLGGRNPLLPPGPRRIVE